ncbi:MAG: regulatory protein RecX [Tissierellia bacterium]|nr:regulatory protein RecX [Tissierellia bacterium]
MILKQILYDEKQAAFKINIDENIYIVDYEFYAKNNLSEDTEVSEELFSKIAYCNDFLKANKIVYKYLKNRKTVQEVYNKLICQNFSSEICNKIIEHYKNLGFLNDREYALDYITNSLILKKESRKKTIFKLSVKGVPKDIILEAMENFDNNIEFDNCRHCFKMKYGEKKLDRQEFQKAYRYLASRGFSKESIYSSINGYDEYE